MGSSSGSTLKSLSNRCLLRLSSDTHSPFHGKTFNEASLTTQRRGFYSFPSPNKLPSFKRSHPLRSFSTSSSSSKVGFLGWYLAKLESYPIITKSVTTSLIFAAADFTSQVSLYIFVFPQPNSQLCKQGSGIFAFWSVLVEIGTFCFEKVMLNYSKICLLP